MIFSKNKKRIIFRRKFTTHCVIYVQQIKLYLSKFFGLQGYKQTSLRNLLYIETGRSNQSIILFGKKNGKA